jgi:hypothetical protein
MIGAYFIVDGKFKAERVINLWLQIFTYCGFITLICLFASKGNVNIVNLIQAFLPVFGRPVWFGAEYICLLIISPFLNKLLEQRDITKRLLQIFGILIIGCATLFPVEHTTPAFSELVWFAYLYLIIGYSKKYMHIKITKFCSICCVVFGYGVICGMSIISDMYMPSLSSIAVYYVEHYEAIPALAASMGLFVVFKNMNLGNSKLINSVAHVTFPVYLIHQTPAFYNYLWNGLFDIDKYSYSYMGILYCIMITGSLFLVAIIVEYIREKIFKLIIYRSKLYETSCEMLTGFLQIKEEEYNET